MLGGTSSPEFTATCHLKTAMSPAERLHTCPGDDIGVRKKNIPASYCVSRQGERCLVELAEGTGILLLISKAVIYVKLIGTDKTQEQTVMLKEGARKCPGVVILIVALSRSNMALGMLNKIPTCTILST